MSNQPDPYVPGSDYSLEFYQTSHAFNISPEAAWDSRFSNSSGSPGWRLNKILKQLGVENGIQGFNDSNPVEIATLAKGIRKWAKENKPEIAGYLYSPKNNFKNLTNAKLGYDNSQGGDGSLSPGDKTVWHERIHKALGYSGDVDSEEDMARIQAYANMYLNGIVPSDRDSFDAFLETRVDHAAPGLYIQEGQTDQQSSYVYEHEKHGEGKYIGFGSDDAWWSVGGGRVDLGEDGLLGRDDDTTMGHDKLTYQKVLQAAGGYIDSDQWNLDNIEQQQDSISDRNDSDPWVQVGRLKNNHLRESAWVLGMKKWESLQDIEWLTANLIKLGYSDDKDDDNYWGHIQNANEVKQKANAWNAANPNDQFQVRTVEAIRSGGPNQQAWGGAVFENETLNAVETDSIWGWEVGKGLVYDTDTQNTKTGKVTTKYLDFDEFQSQPQWQEAAAALGITLESKNDLLAALDWMGADTSISEIDPEEESDEHVPAPYIPGVEKFEPSEVTPPKPLGRMVQQNDPNEVSTTSHQLQILNEDGEYTTGTGQYAYARENLVTLTPKMNIGPLPTLLGSSRLTITNPTAKWTSTTSASDESVKPDDRYTEQEE